MVLRSGKLLGCSAADVSRVRGLFFIRARAQMICHVLFNELESSKIDLR